MTPKAQLAAVEAALAAQERLARIERNWETYKRGVASWLAKVEQQTKAEE